MTDAAEIFAQYLWTHHRLKPKDVVISPVRGYWERREECGGKGKCDHPLHYTMFNEGPANHTIHFAQYGARDRSGRFVSPFAVWRELKARDDAARAVKPWDVPRKPAVEEVHE